MPKKKKLAKAKRVTISFEEIFLFAMQDDRLTVLAPARDHTAVLSGDKVGTIRLTDHVITLLRKGKRATGTFGQNTERHMVHLDDVLGRGTYSLKPTEELIPPLVSARFELGGVRCSLEDRPMEPASAASKRYKEFKWAFGGHYSHRLTNRADFILDPAAGGYQLQVAERSSGKIVKLVDLEPGDNFTAATTDLKSRASRLQKRKTLSEFKLFYELLLDQDLSPVVGSIPYDGTHESPVQRRKRLMRRQPRKKWRASCIEPVCPNAACDVQ